MKARETIFEPCKHLVSIGVEEPLQTEGLQWFTFSD